MFVINWHLSNESTTKNYIFNLRGRFPYTSNISLAKKWKSRKSAEEFLALKDPAYAANCIIEQVQPPEIVDIRDEAETPSLYRKS